MTHLFMVDLPEEPTLPTPEDLMKDRATSDWLKRALGSALRRDPVDAANDAELLAAVLDDRLRKLLNTRHGH